MKEIRDIKIDLVMGNQNPIIDLFCEITSGIEIINCNVYNEEGLEFIYHKDSQWIFYQDSKNEKFWVHHYKFWALFESKFHLKYEEIQAITKVLVEEALKREVSTPDKFSFIAAEPVEEALKREVSTPNKVLLRRRQQVEEALKREVSTPIDCKLCVHVWVEEALKREVSTPGRHPGATNSKIEDSLKRELEK